MGDAPRLIGECSPWAWQVVLRLPYSVGKMRIRHRSQREGSRHIARDRRQLNRPRLVASPAENQGRTAEPDHRSKHEYMAAVRCHGSVVSQLYAYTF